MLGMYGVSQDYWDEPEHFHQCECKVEVDFISCSSNNQDKITKERSPQVKSKEMRKGKFQVKAEKDVTKMDGIIVVNEEEIFDATRVVKKRKQLYLTHSERAI